MVKTWSVSDGLTMVRPWFAYDFYLTYQFEGHGLTMVGQCVPFDIRGRTMVEPWPFHFPTIASHGCKPWSDHGVTMENHG